MICRHDYPYEFVPCLSFGPSRASPPPSPAFSLVSMRYNYLFPDTTAPPLPSPNSPLMPMLQTAGRANYPTSLHPVISTFSHLDCLSLSVVAFCVYSAPRPDGQRRVYAYLSSHIPTLPKKLRVRHSFHLICFCNPKSFLDPR